LEIEQARLVQLAEAVPGVCWDRMLFSAKKSVYKAWFLLAWRWLGFKEASIDIDAVIDVSLSLAFIYFSLGA
jgi:4'-phosphopantetheinyl transferase EntD